MGLIGLGFLVAALVVGIFFWQRNKSQAALAARVRMWREMSNIAQKNFIQEKLREQLSQFTAAKEQEANEVERQLIHLLTNIFRVAIEDFDSTWGKFVLLPRVGDPSWVSARFCLLSQIGSKTTGSDSNIRSAVETFKSAIAEFEKKGGDSVEFFSTLARQCRSFEFYSNENQRDGALNYHFALDWFC